LIFPGAGQLLRGEYLSALGVLVGSSFFWLAAIIELVVANQSGYPAPLVLIDAISDLHWPLTILPQLVYASICAITLHVGAAVMAGRAELPPTSARVLDQA